MRILDEYLNATKPNVGWSAYAPTEALGRVLIDAELDLSALRTTSEVITRPLPSLAGLHLRPTPDTIFAPILRAPNVVGVVEGTDSTLKSQHLVVVAHMDNRGEGTPLERSEDNATGVATLLELARFFGHPDARPRRSIVLVATSGGAVPERWGSSSFAETGQVGRHRLVPVVAFNLDGFSPGHDTLVIDGLGEVTLPARPDWILAEQPELHLHVASGGTVVTTKSDHTPFVRKAIPTLWLHGKDAMGDGSRASSPGDAEARIGRFAFAFLRAIANAEAPPKWTTQGRSELAKFLEP